MPTQITPFKKLLVAGVMFTQLVGCAAATPTSQTRAESAIAAARPAAAPSAVGGAAPSGVAANNAATNSAQAQVDAER